MKKAILGALLILCGSNFLNAQDAHFSQFFASPLTLNPAQAGLTPNDWRASANYRTQWYNWSNNPYVTATAGFDLPVLRGKLPEGDALGLGLNFAYDKAGTGSLTNLTGGLSVAYHKSFGVDKRHTISLGVQGAFVQKSINFQNLKFGDQLDPSAIDAYLPTAEIFGNQDVSYPDFNAGILYSTRVTDKATFYGGFSYYHLTQPTEKFLGSGVNTDAKINSRYSAHLGGSVEANENIVVYLSGLYQQQGQSKETVVGGAVGFILNPMHDHTTKNTIFYLGSWYRFGDALLPYIGLEWEKMQIGLSYDITLSKAATAVNNHGAYEISLIYNGIIDKIPKRKYNFACPRF